MKETLRHIYKGLWLVFAIILFAIVDMRLPSHGFEWVQSSEWWQAIKVAILYILLPYLGLRLFEIVTVGKNHAQVDNEVAGLTTDLGEKLADLADAIHELRAVPTEPQAPPTIQQVQQQQLADERQHQQALPGNLPSWDVGNIVPMQGNPIPTTDLDRDLAQAVLLYAQWGSYAKAAARLGGKITGEGIRQRVIAAYQKDPEWVMQILPADKLPKV